MMICLVGLTALNAQSRRRLDRRRRIAERRTETLLEASADAVLAIGEGGSIRFASSSVHQLLGYSGDELLETRFGEYVDPDRIEAVRDWMYAVWDAPTGQTMRTETRLRGADGEWVYVDVIGMNIKDDRELPAVVVSLRDIGRRRALEAELQRQAYTDPLTGMPNRAFFADRLEQAVAARQGRPVTLLLLDLDDFKLVNDTRGHEAGDQLLLALAPRLSAALRPGDTIARFGGDEFVVLCEDLSSDEDGIRIAQRMTEACRRPVTIRGHRHEVTVSAGVAIARGRSATASDLLRDADAAMYRAKEMGKGRIEVFDDGMRAQLVDRVGLESDLRRALERDELRLLYQPVISLHDERIVGVEALLRWEHPERGLLEPAEFIDVAESTGLILPIGRWVIDEACRQAANWSRREPGGPPLHVSVNLSPRQVLRSDIAGDVAASLRASELDPSLLELEIEERVLLEDPEASRDVLDRLARLGVRLVIDDFGSGYSSLSHLSRMMIDAVKIDRSLVDSLDRRPEESAVVEAVLSVAGALDVGVTAEGVETPGQLSQLRARGCEYAQGYLFSRPERAERVSQLLADPRGDRIAA
jgi:diguanylate cyclase (GGDEF)-like protein/PAS domain S-box-containing protein